MWLWDVGRETFDVRRGSLHPLEKRLYPGVFYYVTIKHPENISGHSLFKHDPRGKQYLKCFYIKSLKLLRSFVRLKSHPHREYSSYDGAAATNSIGNYPSVNTYC
jgi:hypothetical protein